MKRLRRFWPFSRNTYKGRHRAPAYEAAPPHIPEFQHHESYGAHPSSRDTALGALALGAQEASLPTQEALAPRSVAAIGNLAVTITEVPSEKDPLTITGEIVKVPAVISTLLREVVVPDHERQPLETNTLDIHGLPAINRRMMDVIAQEQHERARRLTYHQLNEQADQALSAARDAVAAAYTIDEDVPPIMRETQHAYSQHGPSNTPITEAFANPSRVLVHA